MTAVGRPFRGWTTENGFRFVVALYALRMFFPAAMLAFSAQASTQFDVYGLPPWTRWALAISEMLGSVLLNFPRVFYVGCVILMLDLAGAVILHLKLGENPIGFYVLAGVLVLLIVLRSMLVVAPRKE